MPDTGNTEIESINTLNQTHSVNQDESDDFREPLLDLLNSTERSSLLSREKAGQVSVQYNSFPEQSSSNTTGSSIDIKQGQTVIERPINSVTQSAMFENS